MENTRDYRLDETTDETGARAILGKFVGEVRNFPNGIRQAFVLLKPPSLIFTVDATSSQVPSGSWASHYVILKVELVLLLEIVGLVIVFAVGAHAKTTDLYGVRETEFKPRMFLSLFIVASLPAVRPVFSVNHTTNWKAIALLGKPWIRSDLRALGTASQIQVFTWLAKNFKFIEPDVTGLK